MEFFLVKPSLEYKEGFLNMVKQYRKLGEKEYYDMYKEATINFERYVRDLKNIASGKKLPIGWVASETYWLTDENKSIIGNIRIRKNIENKFLKEIGGHIGYDISPIYRHKGFGNLILKLGIVKAKKIGFNKLLITAQNSNIASIKVIKKNGGVFESQIFNYMDNMIVNRYWIKLDRERIS